MLSNSVNNIKLDISSLQGDINKIEDSISILKSTPNELNPIKQDIIDLSNTIDSIQTKLSDIDDNKKSINNITIKQNLHSKDINDVKDDINALRTEDNHIFKILDDIQNALSDFADNVGDISIGDLVNQITKLENADTNLHNNIAKAAIC